MTRIQTILHPTDFSGCADDAFRLACSLARDHGARLILVHVQEAIVPVAGEAGPAPLDLAAERETLRKRLNALRAEDPRIALERCLLAGAAADAIISLAEERPCDLIVMGTHGRTGLGRVLVGSVAEGVLRKAPCPVLTVKRPVAGQVTAAAPSAESRPSCTVPTPPGGAPPRACGTPSPVREGRAMTGIKTILHPTDFSEHAGRAFRLACSLARDHGARLILLHVQPTLAVVGGVDGPVAIPVPEDQSALLERLNNLRPGDDAFAVEHSLRVGDAAEEIVRLAEEAGCDLIVMGTHGRTGLRRLLMGSVAEDVLRAAPCPVLTVKHPIPGAEPGPGREVRVTMKMG